MGPRPVELSPLSCSFVFFFCGLGFLFWGTNTGPVVSRGDRKQPAQIWPRAPTKGTAVQFWTSVPADQVFGQVHPVSFNTGLDGGLSEPVHAVPGFRLRALLDRASVPRCLLHVRMGFQVQCTIKCASRHVRVHSFLAPVISSMTVWFRRVDIRIRLVSRSGSLSYSPCRTFPRISEPAGSTVYTSTLSGSASRRASHLGTRRTHSIQQVSAGSYHKRCSIFVYFASATGILHLRILFCRGVW